MKHHDITIKSLIKSAAAAITVTALLFLCAACGSASSGGSGSADKSSADKSGVRYTHISMDEAQEMIESGEPDKDYILLDTREVNVYNHDHIPGAICIPEPDISALDNDAEIPELPDKDQKIIVYCQFGGVSKIAAEKLCDMGYTNIYEFDGMDYWKGDVESNME